MHNRITGMICQCLFLLAVFATTVSAAHEISGGKDHWYEILGNRSNTAEDPPDGIALNEKFSYEIAARGNELKVTVSQHRERGQSKNS